MSLPVDLINFQTLLRMSLLLIAVSTGAYAQSESTKAPPSVTVRYAPSTALIANPERGFYHHITCNSPLSRAQLEHYRVNEGNSLILCVFYLKEFKTTPISQLALDLLQQQMDTVRAAGMKAILRFAYTSSGAGDDATPMQVSAHLTQLAPFLAHNKDVIVVVQTGLVGDYGEWANSRNFGSSNNLSRQNWTDRKALTDQLLHIVPRERMIQLRTPEFKTRMYGASVLAPGDAFNGSTKARIGHHNDCFLAKNNDYGTYTNVRIEYPWLAAETTYLPAGGETCNYISPRSDCPNALHEMAMFHWSYLNINYNTAVLNVWKKQGCFDEVKTKLGYRFVLSSGTYPTTAKSGGAFAININLRNEGWAAPFNRRDVELVLRHTKSDTLHRFKLNVDPRLWLAGQSVMIKQTVTLPADMRPGRYTALLNFPDPEPALRNRVEYAIQMANNDLWEPETGLNALQHTIVVTPRQDSGKSRASRDTKLR